MKPFGIDLIDRQADPGRQERDAGTGDVAGLEELRERLVLKLLAARLVCEQVEGTVPGLRQEALSPEAAQGRLCEAVRDLERVDDLLHEARIRSTAGS